MAEIYDIYKEYQLSIWAEFLVLSFGIFTWIRQPQSASDNGGAKYGEIFKLRVGYHNWVVINSPQAFREILDQQSIITSSKMPAPVGDDVISHGMRMFTLPYGPKWRTY